MINDIDKFERLIRDYVQQNADQGDPAHDFEHFCRVVYSAKKLAKAEGARLEVVMPAAWLHDLVNVPKNDPRRKMASRLSAEAAKKYLQSIEYPDIYIPDIVHAIEAHSYSAQIDTRSLEADIVQDADRLDGLGAIGIARVFAVGGLLKRPLYCSVDPFAETERQLDDLNYTIDHFYVKLFKVSETLKTKSGRVEGKKRVDFMRLFLDQLKNHELSHR